MENPSQPYEPSHPMAYCLVDDNRLTSDHVVNNLISVVKMYLIAKDPH